MNTARAFGRRLFPSLAAERAIRFERGVRDRAGVPDLARKVSSHLGRNVLDGPFEGLILTDGFEESMASPVLKLLGQYECQLRTPFMTALAAGPKLIANVGCADGYYAAGLALHARSATVAAFDISRSARYETEQLAALNGVADRVRVHGRCRDFPNGFDLVICDIEAARSRSSQSRSQPFTARRSSLRHTTTPPEDSQIESPRDSTNHRCGRDREPDGTVNRSPGLANRVRA